MALKIRLARGGAKKRPYYRIVIADSRMPRDGRFIEDLGRYAPLENPISVDLKNERVLYWLENGAQPTDTVRAILSKHGLMLALHMKRKGSTDDEIWPAVEAHRAKWSEAESEKAGESVKQKRAALMIVEEARAKELAAEATQKLVEREAKVEAEAENIRKAAAEDREKAAEEARAVF